jgi:hypothetical protein
VSICGYTVGFLVAFAEKKPAHFFATECMSR